MKTMFNPFQQDVRFRTLLNFTLLEQHGIRTLRQARIIVTVCIQPGISTAELADVCKVENETVRATIKRCTALGLIKHKRVQSTVNGGFLTYHPTPDGLALAHKLK